MILPANSSLFDRFNHTGAREQVTLYCLECAGEDKLEETWTKPGVPTYATRLELMRRHLREKHANEVRSYAHGKLQEAVEAFYKAQTLIEDCVEDARSEGVPQEEIDKVMKEGQ